MKNFLYLLILFSIASCNEDKSDEVSPGFLIEDDLMSNGDPTDPNSRHGWNQLRLTNPETGLIPANIRSRELEFSTTLPVNYNKAYSWEERGPFNVGGRTRTIAFDVLDENIWLAGGVTGGMLRSTDAGASWDKTTDQLQMHSITSVVQDTRAGKESTWYAGTGETYAINSQTSFEARFSGNGLLKSTDNGLTWTEIASTVSDTPETYLQNGDMDFVWRVVIDPSDMVNDVVLAAVYNGVYRSPDGGTTWDQVLGFTTGGFSNPGSDNLDLVVTPSGVFYCTMSSTGPDKGVYRSEDGINWTNIIPTGFVTSYGRLTMAINPLDENIVWFFGATNSGIANGHSLYRYEYVSGDGSGAGGLWDNRTTNLPNVSCSITGITTDLGMLSTQSSFDVHIGIHPTDTNTIYIAGTSIWRNTDGFTDDSTNSWIGGYYCDTTSYDSLAFNYSYENHHPDQHYITFLPSDPSILVNINDGGIYHTVDDLADTVQWVSKNNGYMTTQFYAIAIEHGETTSDVIVGGMQDNGTWFTNSANFNDNWKYIGLGDGMYCGITSGGEYYVTSSQRGKLRVKKIDVNGNVLSHERIDPEGGPTQYNWANSFKLDPSFDKRIFWNGRTKLWRLDNLDSIDITNDRSTKEDEHWTIIDESLVDSQASIITDIEMCESDSDKVWYGTANAYVYRLDSANGNSGTPTRVNISGPDFPTSAYVSCISVNPTNSDHILVTFANYGIPSVWWTTNGGDDWTDISGNLEENPDGSGSGPAVFWAEYYTNGVMFVGTSIGLLTTGFPDGLNTVWTLEPGIGNVSVDHMDFRTYDGKFVVGTHGQGVYSTTLPSGFIGLDEQKNELSVYPTMATEWINVQVPPAANSIEVYSLSGQLVYSGNISTEQFKVNVSNFQSGTYIVAVKSEDDVWTRKVMKI